MDAEVDALNAVRQQVSPEEWEMRTDLAGIDIQTVSIMRMRLSTLTEEIGETLEAEFGQIS